MAKGGARPEVALSIGCPAGIGPEVAVSAAAKHSAEVACLLVGDHDAIVQAAVLRRVARRRLITIDDPRDLGRLAVDQLALWGPSTQLPRRAVAGKPDANAGRAQLAWIDEAADLVLGGACRALVTAPVSKAAIASSGGRTAARFRGHTEHLARHFDSGEPTMAFVSGKLTTSLVTTHLPLKRVARAITEESVARASERLGRLLARRGRRAPRIAVAALNPHAGEDGLLGGEEIAAIGPGIALARRRLARAGIDAVLEGPLGAESAFRRTVEGAFDGVVAMYHDQATIAHKLLGFGEAVNVTLGLPIVRTSVDHGTAYDLAGTGRASDRGMCEALLVARELVLAQR
jgi:4-hydroxythreonine-4-phosphate dehydrogenase